MKKDSIYRTILECKQTGKKQFAWLIDPDRIRKEDCEKLAYLAREAKVDMIFMGGSLVVQDHTDICVERLRNFSGIPVVMFPGSVLQVSRSADALLFLSVISGRNPEMLIGQHVVAAPLVKKWGIEAIPTGYMLIDSGRQTAASYMSQTTPIPRDKYDIAACTALAGELLGLKMIFMDGGSGANQPVNTGMIHAVREQVALPLIVGGGIDSAAGAQEAVRAGADIVVVGNAIEKNLSGEFLKEFTGAVHTA